LAEPVVEGHPFLGNDFASRLALVPRFGSQGQQTDLMGLQIEVLDYSSEPFGGR
jgi:hypothetical protein